MTESQDIASEARRRAEAVPAPRAEALEKDLWVEIVHARKPADRAVLEVMALGVGQLIEAGKRDIRPDEDEAIRQRMKEILNADLRPKT
jgi:hypothetical protein